MKTSITGESDPITIKQPNPYTNPKKTKFKGTKVAKVGDLISVPATFFDNEPGSISSKYPERCFGAVEAVCAEGLARVRWIEDNTIDECNVRDLTVERIADIGTKALHEATFVRLRDMINGYALVKARSPELQLPQYVCNNLLDDVVMTYAWVEEITSQQQCKRPKDEQGFDIRAYYDNSDEIEEEEDEDSKDSDDGPYGKLRSK